GRAGHRRARVRHGLELTALERGDETVMGHRCRLVPVQLDHHGGHDQHHGHRRPDPDPGDPGPAPGPRRRLAAARSGLPVQVGAGLIVLPDAGRGPGVTAGVATSGLPGGCPALTGILIGPARGHAWPGPRRVLLVVAGRLVPVAPARGAGITPAACRRQPAGPGWRESLLSHGASGTGSGVEPHKAALLPAAARNQTTAGCNVRTGRTIGPQDHRPGPETPNRRAPTTARRGR